MNKVNSWMLLSMFLLSLPIGCSKEKQDPIEEEPEFTGVNPAPNERSVRVLYLVPADEKLKEAYIDAVKTCITELQDWYETALGNGKTFQLNGNFLLETLQSDKPAAWFDAQNDNTGDPLFYFVGNARQEVKSLLKEHYDTENHVYMVYVDAPGATGAGSPGFTAMPRNDLLGLSGQMDEPISRWIGGAGHELGHGFGMPHPENENPQALMWTGYTIYPECILQAEDKTILSASPFFVAK